jgi:hypothetical protein
MEQKSSRTRMAHRTRNMGAIEHFPLAVRALTLNQLSQFRGRIPQAQARICRRH